MDGRSDPFDDDHPRLHSPDDAVEPASAPTGGGIPPTVPSPEPIPAMQLIACWRCHKWVPDSATICPHCEARLKVEEHTGLRVTAENPDNPYCSATIVIDTRDAARSSETSRRAEAVTRVVWFFLAILGVGVVHGLAAHAVVAAAQRPADTANGQLALVLAAEGIDILLVLFALFTVPRPPPLVRSDRQRLAGWFLAIPILAVVLTLNFAYHWLLRKYLRLPDHLLEPEFGDSHILVIFAVTCVQPAFIEELFFRYLALGSLRAVAGIAGAIWMSSIMFGMAHIGMPLSIPILIIVGVGLGYARVLSGSMVLPMLMHFVHNTVVMIVNGGS
jgi:uncharacterized protein